jgi:hypothetical protein
LSSHRCRRTTISTFDEAKAAWTGKKGAWKVHGRKLLLGYEYRLCIKLGMAKTASAGMKDSFQRICIDLRGVKSVGLFGWHSVPPPHRMWVWNDDKTEACIALGIPL